MYYKKNYERLISNDFEDIKLLFKEQGYAIYRPDDIGTYEMWIQRGRKVRPGEVSLHIVSSKKMPKPIYKSGSLQYDCIGRPVFGKFHTHWSLFAIQQTSELTR